MCYRLLCKGSKHQGEIVDGGSQCCCIALTYLSSDIPKSSADVDHILELGTSLYRQRCQHGGYMLIQELEGEMEIRGRKLLVSVGNPKCGTIMQTQDNNDALAFTLETALEHIKEESSTFFLTIGNAPGSTIGVKHQMSNFIVMDSHSRDDRGMCCPNGKSVVMKFEHISNFIKYVREMAQSLSSNDVQFEITGLSLHNSPNNPPVQPSQQQSNLPVDDQHQELNEQNPPVQNCSATDISRYLNNSDLLTDEIKYSLIQNRKPVADFTFPSRIYKDKRRRSGIIHRRCTMQLFDTFDFITYSESKDGLFCLGCVLFPNMSHRRPKKLITEPYFNWKDAREDLKQHNVFEYHVSSMAQLHALRL